MSTLAPSLLKQASVEWDHHYASAVFSGIVGDQAHMRRGGYHVSLEDQPYTNNYSAVGVDDAAPPGNWRRDLATALDMSMSKSDMALSASRWAAVYHDQSDPRRKYFRGFQGWTGTGSAQRWDFVKNTITDTTRDHEWHQHTEVLRRYAEDPMMYEAMISISSGESKATWIAKWGGGEVPAPAPTPVPRPPGGGDHRPGSRVLRLTTPNMRGADVLFLQRWIGGGKLKLDGVFGPKTEARVKWYQGMRRLKVDGIVGPRTWAQMGVRMR